MLENKKIPFHNQTCGRCKISAELHHPQNGACEEFIFVEEYYQMCASIKRNEEKRNKVKYTLESVAASLEFINNDIKDLRVPAAEKVASSTIALAGGYILYGLLKVAEAIDNHAKRTNTSAL